MTHTAAGLRLVSGWSQGCFCDSRFAYLRAVTHTAAGCVWLVAGLRRKGRRVAARWQPGAERLLQFAIPRSHLSPSWGTLPSCSLGRQRGLVAAVCDTGSVGRSGRASAAGEWPRAGPPGQLRSATVGVTWPPCGAAVSGPVLHARRARFVGQPVSISLGSGSGSGSASASGQGQGLGSWSGLGVKG